MISFSGLETAVAYRIKNKGTKNIRLRMTDLLETDVGRILSDEQSSHLSV